MILEEVQNRNYAGPLNCDCTLVGWFAMDHDESVLLSRLVLDRSGQDRVVIYPHLVGCETSFLS